MNVFSRGAFGDGRRWTAEQRRKYHAANNENCNTNSGECEGAEERARLAVLASIVRFKKGEEIYREGQRALNRIRHLHHDEHQVRLLLAPGDIAGRIVARLAEPGQNPDRSFMVTAQLPRALVPCRSRSSARIEESKQRGLGRHIVEAGRPSTGLES